MEELLKLLGFTTPLIYAGAAYAFFHWLDENASDEAKAALTRTMRWKDYKSEEVASALVEVFDRIYTYPLLRWRAFWRSLMFTTIVSEIWVFEWSREIMLNGHAERWKAVLVFWLFNVFSDYLALFVVRPVLIRSGKKPVIGLTLGTVSGAAIVLVAYLLRKLLLELFVRFGKLRSGELGYLVEHYLWTIRWDFTHQLGDALIVMFLPALLVFSWLPLFAFGIVIARLLTPLSWIVGRTQWFLKEGKEHPLKAIGYVAAVVVFLGTVAARAVFSA
jgi:hypothetical protein